MKKLLLFAIISMFVLVTSAGSKQFITEKAYQIMIPQGWTQTSDLPYGIDVGFSKTLKEGETATFFFHYEIMPPELGEPPTDTSGMQSQFDTMIRNKYPDARTVNKEIPKVDGRVLTNGTYELTDNGAKVRRRYTYFLSGQTAFVVQCSASPSEWANALGEFDEIISTLIPSGSAPVQEKISDDSAVAKLKSDLPTLLGSFPGQWRCSLSSVVITPASSEAKRTLEIGLTFDRSDIREIYKGTKLLFGMMKLGKTDADLNSFMNSLPAEIRRGASCSHEFVEYVGQVWGYAGGYVAASCDPPIEWYKVSIIGSGDKKIGTVSISMEDGIAILSGKVTANEARRLVGMYKFDVQDIVKVEVKNEPNEPNAPQAMTESAEASNVVTSKEFGVSFAIPSGIELYDSNRPGPLVSQISRSTPFYLVNPAFTEENINIMVSEGIKPADIDKLKTMLDANTNMPFPQYKRISVSSVQIGKHKDIKAVEHIFRMKGNIMGQMRQITFVIGSRGFTVTCGTAVDRFDAANKNFFEPFFGSIESAD